MKKSLVNLSLSGMHCASCALLIEKSLKEVDGVIEANVNFAAEKASIFYDETKLKAEDLIKAVGKAGYKAEIFDPANSASDTGKKICR